MLDPESPPDPFSSADAQRPGNLLRSHRVLRGITQEELAERAGISRRALSDLERGLRQAPHRDTLDLLATALQLSAEERAELHTSARRIRRNSLPLGMTTLSPSADVTQQHIPLESSSLAYSSHIQTDHPARNSELTRSLAAVQQSDLARYRETGTSLRSIELTELAAQVGVVGKSLLHLHCNLGSQTISWAKLGAHVTGVDAVPAAIEFARRLADEASMSPGVPRFLCADISELPLRLREKFDIVFSAYGSLHQAPDLHRWAQVVAGCLKPGGVFYTVEMSAAGATFSARPGEDADDPGLTLREKSASSNAEDAVVEREGEAASYVWSYGLGEVLTALLAAGLRLDFVHEFPVAHYQRFPVLFNGADGYWHWPYAPDADAQRMTAPLLFSVLAHK